ncbi:phosphate ABC transporter ATP-binding protein, partial [Halorubrum sp. SS7]
MSESDSSPKIQTTIETGDEASRDAPLDARDTVIETRD